MAELSAETCEYLALMPDGRLFISKSHYFLPVVQGFLGRLKRLGVQYEPVQCDLKAVAEMRAQIAGMFAKNKPGSSHSDMQRFAMALFERAVAMRASDIHIRVSSIRNTEIRMRVHGDLIFIEEHPDSWGRQLCLTIYQAMTDVSDSTFEPLSRQDARISDRKKIPENIDGIRIATTPQVDGFVLVLRLLYNDTIKTTNLVDYGYHNKQVQNIRQLKRRPFGISVIAGPTGSGKSTTLQCILSSIVTDFAGRKHVITVEDPPEYPIPGVVQTPVTNSDTEEERSKAFQLAIKATLRLDPDVIMIGEMRDAPSTRLAFQASMTGHQVWTTLHANGAFEIIDRLLDMGIPMAMLANHRVLSGLICQRLVKVLCPKCKVALRDMMGRYHENDLRRVMSTISNIDNVYVQGPGCNEHPHCRGTGVVGRTVVSETVVTDIKLMDYIRQNNRRGAIDYWLRSQQGLTMVAHTIQKVEAGLVDPFLAEDIVGPLDSDGIDRIEDAH